MKQYIIINNAIKMSKGKIARVCAAAGYQAYDISEVPQREDWKVGGMTTIVLKSDDIGSVIKYLKEKQIPMAIHQDEGRTQVPKDSVLMVTFFCEGDDYINQLKLL